MKKFNRVMVKACEYMEEHELNTFEEQVLAPLYVIDVLRCMYVVESPQRLLELKEVIEMELPNLRTKNGYRCAACGVGRGGG